MKASLFMLKKLLKSSLFRAALGAFISLVLIGLILYGVSRNLAPVSDPIDRSTAEQASFPSLEGVNLRFETVAVPSALAGEYRLVVVAYDTDQQTLVNKWLRPLELLNEQYPQLRGYYLPLLPQDTADAALAIIGGMTLAATSDRDRERTVVVFTDVAGFNDLLDIPDTATLHLFLLDAQGAIQWRGNGPYDPDTLASLETRLAELIPSAG